MNDYQKRLQEHRERLAALVQGIASHLDGWEALPIGEQRGRAYIEHETGAKFGITLDAYGNKERVEVYGTYPHYPHRKNGKGNRGYVLSGEDTPRITCALSREAEAIAKDITRRFLGEHIRCHELAVERIARDERYQDDQEAIMLSLADILGEKVGNHGNIYYNRNDIWGQIEPNGRDDVKIELRRVPAHVAAKICELLASLPA